jgi:peptidoglycan/LPS O-acetylase OafA/YrhL
VDSNPVPKTNDAKAGGRFAFLDALRGIAAVAVMLFHFNNEWVSPIHRQFAALLPDWVLIIWRHLDLGVEVFFVLSGFVIAHSLSSQRVDLRYAANFLLRRMVRLAPPYWVMIALLMGAPYLLYPTLIDGFFERFGGWRGIFVNMFYLPDILGPYRIVPVAWTLCLEVQFYLALLGLYLVGDWLNHLAFDAQRTSIRVLSAMPFAILTLASLAAWFLIPRNVFLDRWWMFAGGVAVHMAMRDRARHWPLALMLGVALLGAILGEPRSVAVALTCSAIFVASKGEGLRTWLNWGWLQYLGRISYSLYLVHLAFGVAAIGLAQRVADGSTISIVTAFAAGILASLIAADLLYRFVEAPSARLSGRLRMKPRTQVTVPAPVPTAPTAEPTIERVVVT